MSSARPAPGAVRPYTFPPLRRVAVPNGGGVVSCHLPGRQLASAVLVVDAGATCEPAGGEGLALITARMLGEGSGGCDAYEFAVATERLGASWHAEADYDSMRLGLDVPAAQLPAAVELLAQAVREPTLDPAVFDRVQAERVDELGLEWSQPGPRASVAFAAAVWAAGSRYAVRDGGEARTVSALTVPDVADFAGRYLRPQRSTLVVAGGLDGVDLDALAERMFGDWDAGAQPVPALRDPAQPSRGARRVVAVDRPGSVQSVLLVGHPGPARNCADYTALTTFALAFAGVFRSRLNYRLREECGYTYGAHGGFDLRRQGGVFAVRTAVESSVSAPALTEILSEIERAQRGGLTESELESVKGYRVGVLPVAFSDSAPVARALADVVIHGLPDDYFDRLRAEVAGLTLPEVNQSASSRLLPDRLVSVVVGDTDALELPPELGELTRISG
ncbi:MAG: M16 family metallopeptidase [Mycobacteriales bacterium]